MPGDDWQKFANLRAYFGFMWTYPGKKLLFMGGEFAQEREWNHDTGLDWYLLDEPQHAGVQALVRDLNHAYRGIAGAARRRLRPGRLPLGGGGRRATRACSPICAIGSRATPPVLVVCNFTPVPRHGYRLGVPQARRLGGAR